MVLFLKKTRQTDAIEFVVMSIQLSFFGDFVSQRNDDIQLDEGIRHTISSSDISVCNFESPVEGVFNAFDRYGPKVKQSVKSPTLLRNWGFNVIQLANNHMLDYGDEGCKATIEAFKEVLTVGAGSYDEAYSVKVINVKEKRIGFLSCVHHEFGVWETKHSTQSMGTAWICHHLIQKRISEAKASVDYLIVLPHAGVEETEAPIPEWRELYHTFIEWGADAVIGTHPHVPQGWETYNGKPIFYSLGNFYFDALDSPHPYWKRSIAVVLDINEDGISYQVKSIKFSKGEISIDKGEEREGYHKYLCDLLLEENYMRYCNKMAIDHWRDYQNWIIRGVGAFSFKLGFKSSIKTLIYTLIKKRPSTLLVNTMQCESHRWTIIRAQNIYD